MTIPVIKRIHRDVFPHTDHGHTWVEFCWYEHDGDRCSAQFPVAGCCERLIHMPGGPIPTPDWEFEERRFTVERTVKSEDVHNDGFYAVGSVSITKTR